MRRLPLWFLRRIELRWRELDEDRDKFRDVEIGHVKAYGGRRRPGVQESTIEHIFPDSSRRILRPRSFKFLIILPIESSNCRRQSE